MRFRLLLDLDVVDFMQTLPRARRTALFAHFRRIQESPANHSDYIERDATGRRVEVSVFDGLAIYYWIDHADAQVKILTLVVADVS
jgi:hypothetical protein